MTALEAMQVTTVIERREIKTRWVDYTLALVFVISEASPPKEAHK